MINDDHGMDLRQFDDRHRRSQGVALHKVKSVDDRKYELGARNFPRGMGGLFQRRDAGMEPQTYGCLHGVHQRRLGVNHELGELGAYI